MWPLLPRCVALVCVVASSGCAGPEKEPPQSAGTRDDYTERIPGTSLTFDMVWIPSAGFWIGRTEVTWAEYLVFCAFNERLPEGVDALSRPSKPLEVYPFDRHWGRGRRPAVGMSRNGAQMYCRWLSELVPGTYRLPSEEEWSAASGSRPARVGDYAWCAENSTGKTQAVGRKRPNVHGLYDMLGNLWEYCANPFDADEPRSAVLRGGSWKDPANEISPKTRLRFEDDWLLDDPGFPPGLWWVPDGDHLGFRMVRGPEDR